MDEFSSSSKEEIHHYDDKLNKKDHCNCTYGGKCWLAVIILVIIAIVIISGYYWVSKYTQKNDLDSSKGIGKLLSSIPGAGAGFWEMTHFVLYGIMGFFFPTCDAIVISLGAFWELVEHYMSLTTEPIRRPNPNGGYTKTQWWYGSAVDIVVDIFGFYVGKSLRLLLLPPSTNNCIHKNCDIDQINRCDGYHNTSGENQFNLLYFR